MARSPANAGSVAVIENPEDQGKIASVRPISDKAGVGLGVDPDVVNGRSGGHRGGGEMITTIGQLTFEDGKPKIEGSLEEYNPREYFNQRTLGILRGVAERLPDGAEVRHYNQVITELTEVLVVDDATKEAYDRAFNDLETRGSEEIAEGVLSFYRDQFRKSFQIIDGYVDERPLGQLSDVERVTRIQQERALLLYSEFVLANIQLNSIHSERQATGREFLDNRLETALAELDISDEQRHALGFAFTALRNSGEFDFTQSCNNVVEHRTEYLPASDPVAVASGGVRLDAQFINDVHFVRANDRIEDAHRLVISALDQLDEPARQRWVAERGQNPEVDLTQNPFSIWQEQIEARIAERENLDTARPMESKDYISGILGTRKEEAGFFGIKRAHELKHHIKNVDHKAPIKRPGSSRDKLENVQATEIAITAGVWQGEWNQGATAKEGESHPKEFYERVVDITVWSVSLNSADAVANFMDQLEAADAMQMNGEVVGAVLGNQADVPNAQAFRVPVLNHRGEPSFLVVDRETYGEMIEVAKVSQASYAELAQKDSRYAVHDRETRHRAFRPQLRENRATPESWVDQERDFILAEEVSRQRAVGLEGGTEADRFVVGQLGEAMERYRAQFNEFQMNFCRESRYRELALGRLTLRGVAGNAPDFDRLLAQEMNAVALEYINRWNAFRAMTTRVLELQSLTANNALETTDLATAERDLLNFLANIDYEFEIQVRVATAGGGEGDGGTDQEEREGQEPFEHRIRQALQPFMRTANPPNRDGLLLENAYQNAVENLRSGAFTPRAVLEPSYAYARLVSDNSPLSRTARRPVGEQVTTISGTSGREVLDVGQRYDTIEAKAVLERVRTLGIRNIRTEGNPTPLGQMDVFNTRVNELVPRIRDVLTRTEDEGALVFPENRDEVVVAQSLEQTGIQLHTLLGRRPTDQEETRFYEGQVDLINRRNSVIDTLEEIGELRTGVGEVVNYPARLLNGRQLTELSQQELVDYACLVYATVRTINSLPENPEPASVRAIYDRFIDEGSGSSVASEYIRRRVHERVERIRNQATPQP